MPTSLAELCDCELRQATPGQAPTSWTCGLEGARGGTYCIEKSVFETQVGRILEGDNNGGQAPLSPRLAPRANEYCLCPEYRKAETPRDRRRAGARA
jgi:hypothetical protein